MLDPYFVLECLGFAYLSAGLLALLHYQDRLAFPRSWDWSFGKGRIARCVLFVAAWPLGLWLYLLPTDTPHRLPVNPVEGWVARVLTAAVIAALAFAWYGIRLGRP